MENYLEKVDFLIGDKLFAKESLLKEKQLSVFSNETIEFLAQVSNKLLNSFQAKRFSDVATFAFYCRRANLLLLKQKYYSDANHRLGKGIVFHITPSNVPVNFAYSLFAGLISGNINILRVPSKKFEQIDVIVNAIQDVLVEERFKNIFAKRIYIVRYDKSSLATSFFSSFCDVRIIWGGDQTINDIRTCSIPAKSTEITFSDRYSISIIKAKSYLENSDKRNIAVRFYNDTYLFDQNACTSPHTLFWIGDFQDVEEAKIHFWNHMKSVIAEKEYALNPITSIDKLTMFYSQAIDHGNIKLLNEGNNLLWRISNSTLSDNLEEYKSNCGYFNEVNLNDIDLISRVVNRKFQTIAYLGFERQELENWIINNMPIGVDRIVPIGRTMDFSLLWDGYNLLFYLSREIEIV